MSIITALAPVPFSAMSAIIVGVSSARMVTSMPTSLIFAPDWSTRRAASGSFQMLASAIGLGMLGMPGWKMVLPMITISRKSVAMSGALASANAVLVSGPT